MTYPGEKWEYLQVQGDASSGVTCEELNQWGAIGWQLCMAYIVSIPITVVLGTPNQQNVRLERVLVYRRPLKEVQP